MTTTAADIRPGDVILPPEREMRLWMRRSCAERGLPESALRLTVRGIGERSDAKGSWVLVTADYSAEWNADRERTFPITFKARPTTPWTIVSRA